MADPGIGESVPRTEGPRLARNLTSEQKDGYQRQLKGILDSGDSAVENTKIAADKFADDQGNSIVPSLNGFGNFAGSRAREIQKDVVRESNKVYAKGSELKDGWSNLVETASKGVWELSRDDMERTEVEDTASGVLGQIGNRRSAISEVFPDLGTLPREINRSLRHAQDAVGRISLDAPDIADQAEELRSFKRVLSGLLDRNDGKPAEGRRITEIQYQRIMDISGEIRKLVEAIAEARLAKS
jgi:hypothetical protein